jgi:hypothetical protein
MAKASEISTASSVTAAVRMMAGADRINDFPDYGHRLVQRGTRL